MTADLHRRTDVTVRTDVTTEPTLRLAAQHAWRQADRCIGRLYWQSLRTRDRRAVLDPEEVSRELAEHLALAANSGRIRPYATVLHPAVRVVNEQLIGYAGWRADNGLVTGDPRHLATTFAAEEAGWRPCADGHRRCPAEWTVLPLILDTPCGRTVHPLPPAVVHEIEITHPDHAWFADLGLRWYTVPAVAFMDLVLSPYERYPVVFSGWYVATEVASENLAAEERFDALPRIARRLGLSTTSRHSMWRERAEVELHRATLWSFAEAGVTIEDDHSASEHYLLHVGRERQAGRPVYEDERWIDGSVMCPHRHGTYRRLGDGPAPPDLHPRLERRAA